MCRGTPSGRTSSVTGLDFRLFMTCSRFASTLVCVGSLPVVCCFFVSLSICVYVLSKHIEIMFMTCSRFAATLTGANNSSCVVLLHQ